MQVLQNSGLMPLLPELVLAIGAMVMLMFGVSVGQGPRGAAIVNAFCIAILLLAGFAVAMMPPGRVSLFGGSFVIDDYARFLKLLTLIGSGGRSDPVARLSDAREGTEIRIWRRCSCSPRSAC